MSTDVPPNEAPTVAELLPDFDFFVQEHADRWEEVLGHARVECPVPRTSATGGYHIVTRYDDVRRVLTDHETFSSKEYVNIAGSGGLQLPPIDADPPLQHDFRVLLNPYFHPKRLAERDDQVRDVARASLAGWVESGRAELMTDYVTPFVTDVLAAVVFEEDDPDLFRRSAEYNDRVSEGDVAAFPPFYELMAGFVEQRRANPRPGDIVDAINTGTVEGRPLTDAERYGAVQILFSGGLDTTKVAISNLLYQLAVDPSLEERLRDPDWSRSALDEFLRHSSPVSALGRQVMKPVELGGEQLKPGDRVLVHYGSANRDESVFPNADELDFDRGRNPHVAFGLGVHRCIGLHLARQQIRVAVDTLLERVTKLRLVPNTVVTRRAGISRVLRELPVEFDLRD